MLKITQDLGKINPTSPKGQKKHYFMFECSGCLREFRIVKADIKKKRTTKCLKCCNIDINNRKATKAGKLFKDKAISVHSHKYSYQGMIYVNSKKPISITCAIHGDFSQRPSNHLRGEGCPACNGRPKKDNSYYDAELLTKKILSIVRVGEYINNRTPILHRHTCGNEWLATPSNILGGHSCGKCALASDFNIIYIWRITGTSTFKIGVTSERLQETRIKQVAYKHKVPYTLETFIATPHASAIESDLHRLFTRCPLTRFTAEGWTEFKWLSEKELEQAKQLINNRK